MKFSHQDPTDKALVAALAREMALCKECFASFLACSHLCHVQPGQKAAKIKAHETYSAFLSHLYEFYVGCIARDRGNTATPPAEDLDKILTHEAQKQLRNRRLLIEKEVLPGGENLLATLPASVPEEFGRHFRLIRNRTAHALTERFNPQKAPSLNEFFKSYHHIILILFFTGQFAWNVKDAEAFEWGDIAAFNFGT
jgi:hypothetical protein